MYINEEYEGSCFSFNFLRCFLFSFSSDSQKVFVEENSTLKERSHSHIFTSSRRFHPPPNVAAARWNKQHAFSGHYLVEDYA